MAGQLGLTEYLAALMGLYFLSAGALLALRPDHSRRVFDSLTGNPALLYLCGIVALAIGGAILGVHSDWSRPLAAFVTAVGWASVVEGALLLALPGPFIAMFRFERWPNRVLTLIGAGTVLAGLLLVYGVLF